LQQKCAFEAMEFSFIEALPGFVYECQRFREYRQPCLWLSHGSMNFGEKR
jgi:hypothetical protein